MSAASLEGTRCGDPVKSPLPFAALPHDLAGDVHLSPTDKLVAAALLFWARDKDRCWPGDDSIGARVGRCAGTVQRCLKRLEAAGWIARERAAWNRTGRVIVLRWRVSDPSPARDEKERCRREKDFRKSTERQRAEPQPATDPGGEPPRLEVWDSPGMSPEPLGDVPANPPGMSPLTPVAAGFRGQLASWAASDDPILSAEAARLNRPRVIPPAPPADTADLISQLGRCPTFPGRLADRLAEELRDRKSLRYYWAQCHAAAPADLADAYRRATKPGVRSPGAVFAYALKERARLREQIPEKLDATPRSRITK